MKTTQELELFIDEFLGERPPSYFIKKMEGIFYIDFLNCFNWSACFHHQNLNKIEQLGQRLNELDLVFRINKIA